MAKTFKGVVSFDIKAVLSKEALEEFQRNMELDDEQENLTVFGKALHRVLESQGEDAAIRMVISHGIREGIKDVMEEISEEATGIFKLSYSPATVRLTGVSE